MNVELFINANKDALPPSIRSHFEKVYERFFQLAYVLCDKEAYEHFNDVYFLTNDENDDAVSDEDFSNLIDSYISGFAEGYEDFDKYLSIVPIFEAPEETKAYRIFSLVYNRLDTFKQFPLTKDGAIFRTSRQAVHDYGKDVGRFIKAWGYVLNNANIFEKMFQEKSIEVDKPALQPIKWEGDKIELIELFKALYESKVITGIQDHLIKQFEAFFMKDLRNHSKAFNDLKTRNNGSETLFIDQIKTKLEQWINKKS